MRFGQVCGLMAAIVQGVFTDDLIEPELIGKIASPVMGFLQMTFVEGVSESKSGFGAE
jgi:hypothetical protein